MRDGTPPRPQRAPRSRGLLSRHREGGTGQRNAAASPPRSRRPHDQGGDAPNPYRAYQPHAGMTSARFPAVGATGARMPGMPGADPGMSMWQAAPHHHGLTLFHDGNAGHLWRGEVASLLGEAVLGVGILMWLAYLVGTVGAVALAVLALGLPWLLAGPLAIPPRNAAEPGRPLKWIGRLRCLLTLGLIPMHYHTILPVVYLLLFGISLCGRLREGGRVAATRTCLAPGELEKVADDLHVGAVVAAVLGPLLATLLFILLGERILLVSLGSFIFFLLSTNSDSFLDALPPARRAFLLAHPEATNQDDEDDEDEDPEEWREIRLPEWYQQGPTRVGQGIREIRDGLGLAGGIRGGGVALWALGLLALVGGGLGVLEVFYLTDYLGQPSFYLGPLVAAEAGGLGFGAALAGGLARKGKGRPTLLAGVASTGVLLAGLALLPRMPVLYGVAFLLGTANAVAVGGAWHMLAGEATGLQRRALAAGESFVVALSGLVGAALFALFYQGSDILPRLAPLARYFPGWPIAELLVDTGLGLVVAAVVCGLLLILGGEKKKAKRAKGSRVRAGGRDGRGPGRLPALADDDERARSDELPAARGMWDDDEGASGEWERQDYEADYGSEYGEEDDSRASRSITGYGPST
nr:hypothetical protein [Ktedonobacterales bacterium]